MVFNEDMRVKVPATIHFMRLGYRYQSLKELKEHDDIDFNTKIIKSVFKKSIEKINNKSFSDIEIQNILDDIHNVIKNNDLGKEFYKWLRYPYGKVKLIDLNNIDNNDFMIVDELSFNIVENSNVGSFRPDINIFINGIPLAFLEVKHPNNSGGIQKEFDRMINQRLKKEEYKKYFNMIQFVSFSNNMEYEKFDITSADVEEIKAGSFYTSPNGNKTFFSHFREKEKGYIENYKYQEVSDVLSKFIIKDCNYSESEIETEEFKENLKISSPCNSFITSVFDKERFIFFIKYGIMYLKGLVPEKHIMRYPQFFAARRLVERLKKGDKRGIIWHTQGSGKTELAGYLNKILIDFYSEQQTIARQFFVVDRLELLTQAAANFRNMGINVIECRNKEEFVKELNKSVSTSYNVLGSPEEIIVVNIQKFEDDFPVAPSAYNSNVQRIFFVDEAHRSYSLTGEFFKNLMTCDKNAAYVALTGTPILNEKERTKLKFGDYVDTYFYSDAIADGYTLGIKKETITTAQKTSILRNLDIENPDFNSKDIYESTAYVSSVSDFIYNDFSSFRIINDDNTLGGMIVCRSNEQAKRIHQWFVENSNLKTGLVISDSENHEQSKINKENQINFREKTDIDILIVHYMLTTGYDVKRLKKLYLLRGPKDQSLLQTITRVNRPYTSPSGKKYKFGYITDFADIESEFERTMSSYLKELEEATNKEDEDKQELDGLVIDKEVIKNKFDNYLFTLTSVLNISNLELFTKQLNSFNYEKLSIVKKLIMNIKECYIEFRLSDAEEYYSLIDINRFNKLLKIVNDRIDFLKIKSESVEMMKILSNEQVVDIVYSFIKTKITILNLKDIKIKTRNNPDGKSDEDILKDLADRLNQIQNEIKKNSDTSDIRVKKLDNLLEKMFERLNISDFSDLDEIFEELDEISSELNKINSENRRLSLKYGGHYSFVKTINDAMLNYSDKISKEELEMFVEIVYNNVKDILDVNNLIVQGKKSFIDMVKKMSTREIFKVSGGLYSKIMVFYDEFLGNLYDNILIIK